jgi:hypothetical protein
METSSTPYPVPSFLLLLGLLAFAASIEMPGAKLLVLVMVDHASFAFLYRMVQKAAGANSREGLPGSGGDLRHQ